MVEVRRFAATVVTTGLGRNSKMTVSPPAGVARKVRVVEFAIKTMPMPRISGTESTALTSTLPKGGITSPKLSCEGGGLDKEALMMIIPLGIGLEAVCVTMRSVASTEGSRMAF